MNDKYFDKGGGYDSGYRKCDCFWGGGDIGASVGYTAGAGASISGMYTRSWYQGTSDVVPKSVQAVLLNYLDVQQNFIEFKKKLEELIKK